LIFHSPVDDGVRLPFTADLHRVADWLVQCGVKTVAMEKRVVSVLRSPSSEASGFSALTWIGEVPAEVRRDLPPALWRGFAHSMQNFALGEFSVSHEGHRRVNGDAHSSQNFARSGFSAPHFEQRIANPHRSQDGPD